MCKVYEICLEQDDYAAPPVVIPHSATQETGNVVAVSSSSSFDKAEMALLEEAHPASKTTSCSPAATIAASATAPSPPTSPTKCFGQVKFDAVDFPSELYGMQI